MKFSVFKKVNILAVILISLPLFLTPFSIAKSSDDSYYSGEAIGYNGRVIFGSLNMGELEVFSLDNDKIKKELTLIPSGAGTFDLNSNYDFLFNIENNRLYLYVVNGRYLSKYDISIPANPVLINKVSDSDWDWFLELSQYNGRVVTRGSKGLKIWNYNLETVDRINLENKFYNSLTFSQDGKYLLLIDKDKLSILDVNSRRIIGERKIDFKYNSLRNVYTENGKDIYLVDDVNFTKINFNPDNGMMTVKKFKHISDQGYDVGGLAGSDYLYFSDGFGVVKINKYDLKPVDWVYTTDIATSRGWAMGARVVSVGGKDRTVVFNNSSIIVLDENLNLINSVSVSSNPELANKTNHLYLNLDRAIASSNSTVVLQGGGFGPNEEIWIDFVGENITTKTDAGGNFKLSLKVPPVLKDNELSRMVEIKVAGVVSGLKYNISLEII
jgi:hypothetical protein